MYASTSLNASASSAGMTESRASRPSTSSRSYPVARSHASLKRRMRPPLSRTQTSACVVSVNTRANASPRTNSPVISDVEKRCFVQLDRQPLRAGVLGRELSELLTGFLAGLERGLIGPEGDDECLAVVLVLQPDQPAVAGGVAQPGLELIPEDLEACLGLLRGRLQDVHAREHDSVLHSFRAVRRSSSHCVGSQPARTLDR